LMLPSLFDAQPTRKSMMAAKSRFPRIFIPWYSDSIRVGRQAFHDVRRAVSKPR
jgi:hypothetical protein